MRLRYTSRVVAAAGTFPFVSDAAQRVMRSDSMAFDKFERTPSGGLVIPGFIGRTGVQVYRDGGVERRELRLPEEVFAPEALASFNVAPLTDLHPDGDVVDTENWARVAKGLVTNARKADDGTRVAADIIVLDGEEIRLVESRERRELSGGYTCDLEQKAGVWNGEAYTHVQRNIRGNHVGLGPSGWGRAGAGVALRLDSKEKVMKVRVDGIEYEAGSESHVQAIEKLVARKDGELATLTKERDELKGRADGLEATNKQLVTDAAAAKKKLEEATSPEEIDKRVAARVGLVDRARRILGPKYDGSGRSDREVMGDTLKKSGGVKIEDAHSDDYVRGRFEHVTEAATTANADGGDDDEDDMPSTKKDGGADLEITHADGDEDDGGGTRGRRLEQVRKDNADFYRKAESRFAMKRA